MTPEPAVVAPRRLAFARTLRRWRDPQKWRLASGLVLFAFALTHFLNHALGHVSLEAMEQVQEVRRAVWRSWPGSILLYGSLALHAALALWKLARRRSWRVGPWDAAQIALGLAIPLMAVAHVVGTRGLSSCCGFDDRYTTELRILWPGLAATQSLLLVVVWLHAVLGLHFWLRPKEWYRAWSPALLVAAVLIPTLSITGYVESARRVAAMSFPDPALPGALIEPSTRMLEWARTGIWSAFGVAAAAALGWRLWGKLRSGPQVTYPGVRTVRATLGATLLETSRAGGIPHAAVCGGRGRCTTCRVQVIEGGDRLPAPNPTEAAALARIHAPAAVRLACQIRPAHSLSVRPLVPMREVEPMAGDDAYRWGVERRITIMFADLRGFTRLAERLYPYDAVFLLNRYFEVMSEAIERHGGEVDKFLGDGIMALFGVAPGRGGGSRDALLAARAMLEGLDGLNAEFQTTLREQLRMGVGVHTGPAVLGRVGGGSRAGLTALGDSVNIASRLEALNKELDSVLVVSSATVEAAGVVIPGAEIRDIALRGRAETLAVHVALDRAAVDAMADNETPVSA
jgi:adenylate cyclase